MAEGINGYVPRHPSFEEFHNRTERWACLVAHRRAGKTVACVAELVFAALFSSKQDGRYAYVAPQYNQAKDIAWIYIKRLTADIPNMEYNETELRADFPNGSRIRLYGADNPDRLRGIFLDGCVLDEYADMKPRVWGEIIRPLLADRQGWAVFIGTPKGHNSFYEIWKTSNASDRWFSASVRASTSGLLPPTELEDAARGMTQDQYEQEFECSFEAAILGAYYGKELKVLEDEGRITLVEYDRALPVFTAWDLGYHDDTAIFFYQVTHTEIHVIDFYSGSGLAIEDYAGAIKSKGYKYGKHYLPHDARAKTLASGGKSVIEQLAMHLGIGNLAIVSSLSVQDGIQAARLMLPKVWFDKEHCEEAVELLKQYQREWDEDKKTFRDKPRHDFTSHACLDGDSLVTTAKGLVPIRDIVNGDYVLTPAGYAKVLASGATKVADEIIEVLMSDGRALLATPEHKIFTTRGVVCAGALRYNDSILTMESAPCLSFQSIKNAGYRDAFIESFKAKSIGFGLVAAFMAAKSAAKHAYCILRFIAHYTVSLLSRPKLFALMGICATPTTTTGLLSGLKCKESTGCKKLTESDFTLSQRATTKQTMKGMAGLLCTDMSGRNIMEKFQADTTFTTLMKTKEITPSKTLNCYTKANMQRDTQKIAYGLVAKQTKGSLQKLANWLKHGTQVLKGWSGIGRMRLNLGLAVKFIKNTAKFAEKNIQQHTQQDQNIATTIAGLNRKQNENRLVYDLTVEHHHCYFANGMLVSNSDAFRMMAVSWKENKAKEAPIPDKFTIKGEKSGTIRTIPLNDLWAETNKRADRI